MKKVMVMAVVAVGVLFGCGNEEVDQDRVIEMQETIINLQEEIAELKAAEPEVVEVEVEVCPEPEEEVVAEEAKEEEPTVEEVVDSSKEEYERGKSLGLNTDLSHWDVVTVGSTYSWILDEDILLETLSGQALHDHLEWEAVQTSGIDTIDEYLGYREGMKINLRNLVDYFGQNNDEIYDYIQHEGYGECWEC